ncbi:ADP-ribosylglycohydrolase family protein [Halogranum rubrum]|uniref:ADP-ribosyl-(Dinitrogen reductase) hydrolase n=1 Tax=Halogranum salarium B-1 TaxID=1210908 RepID=J2ZD03_9EURY|nr:ADP-ribosylglycohydrolase family protein [Halogranum salarium]EJN58555.1 ADP-ribosyl-(dinitrogen reductase) hydrolase [Halogranum salarium B-1]
MTALDNARGALLGLACGDALGRPVEFQSAEQIRTTHGRVEEMLSNGTHGQPAGTVTDDTEMALCIARSLAEREAFAPTDVAARFVEWYESGPFDIGLMTADAVRNLQDGLAWDEAGQRVWRARPEGSNAGNGSVMRCVPYALAFVDDEESLDRASRQSSAITHADPRCTAGCALLNRTVAGLIRGGDDPLARALDATDLPDELEAALRPVLESQRPSPLRSSGYVVHTLQAALWLGLTADSAEEAVVDAVALGEDTDTVGAVTGAIAGARFGASALPERWLKTIREREELSSLATVLYETEFPVVG